MGIDMGLVKATLSLFLIFLPAVLTSLAADGATLYERKASWPETLLNARSGWTSATFPEADHVTNLFKLCEAIKADFPVAWDWALQDSYGRFAQWFDATPDGEWERRMITRALDGLGREAATFREESESLCKTQMPPQQPSWWELYLKICEQRRARRLETVRARASQIVFTKRRTIQPSFFAYTEAQFDAQNERHFRPNSVLCLWTMDARVLAGQGEQADR